MNDEDEPNADIKPVRRIFGERKKRMKRFYNSIRQQIEFYLGDVNLSKDRFFSNLLQESPYIDIDIILKCNKIKNFTEDPADIIKALEKSTILSVSEDKTKIFRTVPVAPVNNADECTIYVEDLPLEVDHDWLRSVFSKYGEIVYVSIPHYKTSRKLKGFAFIQFDTPESANKALEAFRSANSCLSNTMEPKELLSVQTFEGEKDVVVRVKGEIETDQLKCVNTNEESDSRSEEERSIRKRKRRNTNELKETKGGLQQTDSEAATTDTDADKAPIPKKKSKKMKANADQEKVTETVESETDKPKSEGEEHRRHKRKRKKAKKNDQVQTFGMQILSKHDWKKLRNKYLEEQRKRMHELKLQLRQTRLYQKEVYEEEYGEAMPIDEDVKVSECRVKFTPGVIVKLQLDQLIKDIKQFKVEVKRYADVQYIDTNENSYVVYFRCASNEMANQVIGLNKWPNMTILKGDEEQAYWEKIKNDRKQKFEQKIKCNVRGKNKLIKKAEAAMIKTHIRFPE